MRGAARLDAIYRFLLQMTDAAGEPIAFAALEGPSLNSQHREFDLGEISGVMRQTIYHTWGIEPLVVPPTQLKVFASGYGHADKTEVVNDVNQLWGLALTNDNAADAVVLAQIARAFHLRTRCATRDQAEIIAALRDPPAPRKRRTSPKRSTNI